MAEIKTKFPRPKKLTVAVATVLMASASAANALLIEDSLNIIGMSDAVGGIAESYDESASGGFVSGGATSFGDDSIGQGNSFLTDAGRYFASATAWAGSGASGDAEVHWTRTVTNNDGFEQEIFLDAFLYGGGLRLFGPGTGTASYDWEIKATKMNGDEISILDSAVTINGSTIAESGADLGLDDDPDTDTATDYDWSSLQLNDVSLGLLGIDEMLTIDYDLVVHADAVGPTGLDCGFYGGFYGGEGGEGRDCFHADVSTGDPSGVFGNPNPGMINVVGIPTAAIPEPGTLGLLAIAGAGALVARRRKPKG